MFLSARQAAGCGWCHGRCESFLCRPRCATAPGHRPHSTIGHRPQAASRWRGLWLVLTFCILAFGSEPRCIWARVGVSPPWQFSRHLAACVFIGCTGHGPRSAPSHRPLSPIIGREQQL